MSKEAGRMRTPTRRQMAAGWRAGETWDGFTWQAMVFPVGSEFGIDGGRVSKLFIRRGREAVYEYDRGLGVDNTAGYPEASGLVQRVLEVVTA